MKIKTNKYNYLLEIQGNYGYGHGFETLTTFAKSEGKLARAELRNYRENEPYAAHRLVSVRRPNPQYTKEANHD